MISLSIQEDALFRLSQTPNPPRSLFVRGNSALLSHPSIAIVGTRRASNISLRAAYYFARELSRMGFSIVSGLARGVDGAAHQGALEGVGSTIAVLGSGIDRIYPREHEELADAITTKGGCIVSEHPEGVAPLRQHFPLRNRIIAGLSLGTLVVEAAERSGSLITAYYAANFGREVFALTGRYDDLGFRGNHQLIQQGAKLVTSVVDIVSEFEAFFPRVPQERSQEIPDELRSLQSVFRSLNGNACLEELFSQGSLSFSELMLQLATAQRLKLVKELSPQNFSWVGKFQDLPNHIGFRKIEGTGS